MTETNSEHNQDEIHPKPAPPPQVIGTIDVSNLKRMYGNSYGTSGYGILNAAPEVAKSNALVLIAWQNNCQAPDMNPKELLLEGVKLMEEGYADFNSFKHLFGRYDAEWAIHLGSNMRQMKFLAKKAGYMWEAWAAEHLAFIGKRNRSSFMNLARRVDCHKYALLGVDRLTVLCSATAESKEDDPIGSFLQRHKITFDPKKEFDLAEFKTNIDTALNNEKLIKNGITADQKLVRDLTTTNAKFEKSLIQRLKDVQKSGGDVNTCLKSLSINKGQDATETEWERRLTDFNSLSNRLSQTIDYIIRDDDQLEKVDVTSLNILLKKLVKLHKITAPVEDQQVNAE